MLLALQAFVSEFDAR